MVVLAFDGILADADLAEPPMLDQVPYRNETSQHLKQIAMALCRPTTRRGWQRRL